MEEKTWWHSCVECGHEFVLDKENPQVFCPECDELVGYYLDCSECSEYQRVDVTIWIRLYFANQTVVCDFCRQQSYLIRKYGPDGEHMMF